MRRTSGAGAMKASAAQGYWQRGRGRRGARESWSIRREGAIRIVDAAELAGIDCELVLNVAARQRVENALRRLRQCSLLRVGRSSQQPT